ncbi:lasso peptide biosynthesis B2 protein [Bacillus licheniformis]|nr:lasso peptide biosynthesis B2 protein [Bacillus licheniformis]
MECRETTPLYGKSGFPPSRNGDGRNGFTATAAGSQTWLKRISDLDEDDHLVTSCVSIALTIQSILFSNGSDADLMIGVKKIDDKLFSHAWVQMENGKSIDPNHKNKNLKRALVKNHEYFTTVHAFVRMMLLNYDFEEAYEKIAIHLFPLYASAKQRGAGLLDIDELHRNGEYLYSFRIGRGFKRAVDRN